MKRNPIRDRLPGHLRLLVAKREEVIRRYHAGIVHQALWEFADQIAEIVEIHNLDRFADLLALSPGLLGGILDHLEGRELISRMSWKPPMWSIVPPGEEGQRRRLLEELEHALASEKQGEDGEGSCV